MFGLLDHLPIPRIRYCISCYHKSKSTGKGVTSIGLSIFFKDRELSERRLDAAQGRIVCPTWTLSSIGADRVIERRHNRVSKKLQQYLAFAFGVVFAVVLLVLALAVPDPTAFQYTVFRVILALAAAGVAAMIPGFVEIALPPWLRAGGALAIFVVTYFYNPVSLAVPTPTLNPTSPFPIVLACKTPSQVTIDTYKFPRSDILKNSGADAIKSLIGRIPDRRCSQANSTIYRMHDEVPVIPSGKATATSGNNIGLIVLPTDVVDQLGGSHLAFTKIHSYWAQKNNP